MFEKKARLYYLLDEEGRKKSLLAGGNGKELQIIETEVTKEILDIAHVDKKGNVRKIIGIDDKYINYDKLQDNYSSEKIAIDYEISYSENNYFKPTIIPKLTIHYFSDLQTAESLIRWEKERVERLNKKKEELQPTLKKLLEKYQKYQYEKEKKKKEKEKLLKEEKRKEKEKQEFFRKEKIEWIKQHGNQYLKDAFELGYDCQREYVLQRAEKEFPDFVVDFNNTATWATRSCPSHEALKEAKSIIEKGYEVQVVWLTSEPSYDIHEDDEDEYNYSDFEGCEAIVIMNYLGKYDLIKY